MNLRSMHLLKCSTVGCFAVHCTGQQYWTAVQQSSTDRTEGRYVQVSDPIPQMFIPHTSYLAAVHQVNRSRPENSVIQDISTYLMYQGVCHQPEYPLDTAGFDDFDTYVPTNPTPFAAFDFKFCCWAAASHIKTPLTCLANTECRGEGYSPGNAGASPPQG